MGTYKGNAGNLMQHWTLCELLAVAHEQGVPALSFIDAHAMAPLACTRTAAHAKFTRVQTSLPGQGSIYEQAWHRLVRQQRECYPNSASFVREVWKADLSLLLCEIDGPTADKIQTWLRNVRTSRECKSAELFRGDWRDRFEKGLPAPSKVGLSPDALTLVSFDPDMYDTLVWFREEVQKVSLGSGGSTANKHTEAA